MRIFGLAKKFARLCTRGKNRREESRRGRGKYRSGKEENGMGEIRQAKDASSAHRGGERGCGWQGKTRAGGLCLCSFDSTKAGGWPFGLLGRRIGLPGLVWCHDDSTLSLVRIPKMIEAKRKAKMKKKEKAK
jgi:hypothetical protein